MTVTDKQELIINIDGKTRLITRKEIENVFQEKKGSCANYERDNVDAYSSTAKWVTTNTFFKESEPLKPLEEKVLQETLKRTVKYEKKDSIVEEVREDLLRRSQLGIAKYGTTLDRTDVDLKGFLTHLYEEILDSANYIKRTIKEIENNATK